MIDIFEPIGFFGVDAMRVAAMLAALPEDATEIHVRINCRGGDYFEGCAIYSLLKSNPRTVHVEIHGIAASMASLVAMAGDRIVMAPGAMMMVHNPITGAIGESQHLRASADLLDKCRDEMRDIYAERSGTDAEKVTAMMSTETWLTSREALALGFVDGLLEGETMDRNQILSILGLAADATDDQAIAAMQSLAVQAKAAPQSVKDAVPRADYDALNARLATLEGEKAAAVATAFSLKAESVIGSAVAAGKIPPASADYHRSVIVRGGEEALTAFGAYADAVTPIIQPGAVTVAEPVATVQATEYDKQVAARLGVSVDAMLAERGIN